METNWHHLMEKALAELKASGASAAEPYLQKALVYAKEKPEYKAMTYFNFGLVFYDLNRKKEAEDAFVQAVDLIQELLPKNNELYGMFLKTLIEYYQKEGRYKECKKYFLQEIELTRQMFGSRHPYVANISVEYADILLKTSDHAEAEKSLNKALEIMSGAKGPDHLSNAEIHGKLAHCYEKLGRYDDAEFHKGRAQSIEERRGKRKTRTSADSYEEVEQSLD